MSETKNYMSMKMKKPKLEVADILSTQNSKKLFGVDFGDVPFFIEKSDNVPQIDPDYVFDENITKAILAGFKYNKRVLIQGLHGTGKSSHIEQIAARLNWPLIRINLDSQISRMDFVGRDVIRLQDGKQITEFQEGIIPYAVQRPYALVLDEYDAGRADVMFVIQRLLEAEGKFTLLDQNKVLTPHPQFRIFATANTIGLGDSSGMYHGTQLINQGQMDRWNIVAKLDYMPPEKEKQIIDKKIPSFAKKFGAKALQNMLSMAELVRNGFASGDISTTISPRTLLAWADNALIFDDIKLGFDYSFLNKCDEAEISLIEEYYQRCFG